MPRESVDESARFTIPKSQWPRVLLIAVALPALLTVVNDAIGARLPARMPMAVIAIIFSVYIAEMTAMAIAAGAGIRQTWLAWSLLAWLLLTIDLHLIVAAVGQRGGRISHSDLPIAAFAAAQSGVFVVWAAIGGEKGYLRLPVTFVIAGIGLYCWHEFVDALGYDQWTTILFIDLASIASFGKFDTGGLLGIACPRDYLRPACFSFGPADTESSEHGEFDLPPDAERWSPADSPI